MSKDKNNALFYIGDEQWELREDDKILKHYHTFFAASVIANVFRYKILTLYNSFRKSMNNPTTYYLQPRLIFVIHLSVKYTYGHHSIIFQYSNAVHQIIQILLGVIVQKLVGIAAENHAVLSLDVILRVELHFTVLFLTKRSIPYFNLNWFSVFVKKLKSFNI